MAKSILGYGPTGSFKSTQNGYLAKYVYEKYGKKTRIIYTGASDGDQTAPEEAAGIVESFRVGLRSTGPLLSTMRALCRGYWPIIVEVKGQRVIRLVAPTAETWKTVGAVILDSLGMSADEAMRDNIDKGRTIGDIPRNPFTEEIEIVHSDGRIETRKEMFAGSNWNDYNFGQQFATFAINALSSLPVEYVYFTAMERKSEEEDASGRTTIYGAEMPGKKLTPKIGALVGDLLHFDQFFVPQEVPDIDPVTNRPKTEEVVVAGKKTTRPRMAIIQVPKTRVYFLRHKDTKTGIEFPAKPRIHSSQYSRLLERWPGGYFEPTLESGLDDYLRFEDSLTGAATDSMKQWREEMDKRMARSETIPNIH